MRIRKRSFVTMFLLVATIFTGRLAWSIYPLSEAGTQTVVKVTSGESLTEIANDLAKHHVLSSTLAFKIDLAIFGAPIIRPGIYVIKQNSSHGAIRQALGSGPNANVLYITPGMTIRQTILQMATIKNASYTNNFASELETQSRKNAFGAQSLEGLLGTGAYILGPSETPSVLIEQMKQRFVMQLRRVGISPLSTLHGLSAYELITAASIVEKEGFYEKNMPQVARVILNRLNRGGGLQMDATILYSLKKDGVKVTPAMLKIDTPYNSYLHPGLTPTPICQVGSKALRSIVDPPVGKWLFFVVVDRSGTEAFAVSYKEHLANIQLARSRGL
ncbi:MAG: endolytic transglycosylase MltG [Actinomycetes bacterium]